MAERLLRDLRDWLAEVETLGEVAHVTGEVDPRLEMSALTYLNGLNPVQPTLLFENLKGHAGDVRVLFNPIGSSMTRLSLALRTAPEKTAMKLVEHVKERFLHKMAPVEVGEKDAPVYENVRTGPEVDLGYFPTPTHWPRDGGAYIGTADVIITKDPDTGRVNLGTYRQMVEGRNRVGYYASPGKDTLLDREKWWASGRPCPVVSVYGVDPLLFMCAAIGFPKQESEYDYIGGLQGSPVEVVQGRITGLPIPARAELVVEGFSHAGAGQEEGPFGEFTGYYGRPGHQDTPYIDVEAVYFRDRPIMTAALMAEPRACEQSLFLSVLRAARIWNDLEACGVPGVKGVWSVPAAAGGFGMTVVSIRQMYPGHAQQAAAIAAQCAAGAYFAKFIYVVDDDVDPSDLEQVIWAATTRCRVSEDIDILRNTWSTYLDPSKNPNEERPYGSKALVYACKEYKNIDRCSRRTALTRAQYEKAVARWNELGMAGEPPEIRTFDTVEPEVPAFAARGQA